MARKNILVLLTRYEQSTFIPPENMKVTYSVPQQWKGDVRHNIDAIYAPSFPNIEDVYKQAGREVYRPEVTVHTRTSHPTKTGEQIDQENDPSEPKVSQSYTMTQEDDGETKIDDVEHWSELSWPKMRSRATAFTDEPIKSKEQAKEILAKAESEGKI